MKTYFIFDRTVRLGTTTFTEGEPVKTAAVRKANNGRLSTNGHLIEETEAKVIISNQSIAFEQGETKGKTIIEIAEGDQTIADEFQLCIDHLLSLGFSMNDIGVHRNNIKTRKNTGSRPGWIGTKIQNLDEVFVGRNNKSVTLGNANWISTSTFLRRVEKGEALFTHQNF